MLRQRRQRRQRAKGGMGKWLVRLAIVLFLVSLLSVAFAFLVGAGSVAGLYATYAGDLPDPNEIVYPPGKVRDYQDL